MCGRIQCARTPIDALAGQRLAVRCADAEDDVAGVVRGKVPFGTDDLKEIGPDRVDVAR
jgi:hypothetical protein